MLAASAVDWANIVRERRLALGLTQDELALDIGMTRQWVSRFESGLGTGSARLHTVLTILDVLDIDPELAFDDG